MESTAEHGIAPIWDADAPKRADLYTARLMLNITLSLWARIKVSAFTQGVTVAESATAPLTHVSLAYI